MVATCQPAIGHFQPMVPVARALVEAGHEVVFATSTSFCRFVHGAGFDAVPVGLDWLESEVDRSFPDLFPDATNRTDIARGWRSAFARAGRAAIPDLLRLLADVRADLVLGESLDLSGPLAAEAADVPHVLVGIGAPRPLAIVAHSVAAPWNAARAALGLDQDPRLDRFCPYLYFDTCPPSLRAYSSVELPGAVWPLRPVPTDAGGAPPRGWFENAGNEPLVYVTMGTVFNRVADAFQPVLGALADEPVRVLVTVGPTRDPATLGPAPRNVWVERYVPQAAVMPLADLVICHAGFNTTVAALAQGVPVLGLPLGADGYFNAFRVAACGAGLHIDMREATADLVRAAVRDVLGNPLYRANAQRLAREIASMPPPATAVRLLEQVVAERGGGGVPAGA